LGAAAANKPCDVVLVVAWRRAAFLLAALERLLQADGSEDHVYVFQIDYGYDPEVLAVACAWPLQKRIVLASEHPFTPLKSNSYTVLEGYRYAEMARPDPLCTAGPRGAQPGLGCPQGLPERYQYPAADTGWSGDLRTAGLHAGGGYPGRERLLPLSPRRPLGADPGPVRW
jgi:hypothetical protein